LRTTFRRFLLPWPVDEAEPSHPRRNWQVLAYVSSRPPRWAGRETRARYAEQEIWPTIFSIVAPCTALSFHLPRRRSLAHTPKNAWARAIAYSLSHAAAAWRRGRERQAPPL